MASEIDDLLKEMQDKVRETYNQAYRDAADRLLDYLDQFKEEDKYMKSQLDNELITQKQYREWRRDKIVQAKQYDSMLETIEQDLLNADQIASSIINGHLPSAYSIGVNSAMFQTEQAVGFDFAPTFTLYNKHTVELLLKNDDTLFPQSVIDTNKIEKVTRDRLTNAITQSIIKGDSTEKTASKLMEVTNMSYNSAVRAARTLTGSAQELGQMESYRYAQSQGIKLQKMWLATPDLKTRDSHRHLDLVKVGVEEKFPNGLMCPLDPQGPANEVINCRCDMISVPEGFEYDMKDRYSKLPKGMTYEEWKEGHMDKAEVLSKKNKVSNANEPKHNIVQGKDLTNIWQPRPDKYDFMIDDIVNAQGFDGLPQVVDSNRFDKAVKESSFVGQRAYGSESEEKTKQFRDEYYYGKWYIQCSGGSAYGYGMYCASEYDGKISESMGKVMSAYEDNKNNRIDTLTLTPDAKIINRNELSEMKHYDYYYGEHKGDRFYYDMDDGVWAAMKGYDAIRVDRREGDCSYTVILNRTKVIYRKDDDNE